MRFCLLLLLLLLFDWSQGSSLPKVRKARAVNTTLQTKFNGTYESRNPCTNASIERGTYVGSQEFHQHSSEGNWSDFVHRCSGLINGFLQTVGNLVRFDNKQNGLLNFHINTSISQKQVPGKYLDSSPTVLIEATDCQVTSDKKNQSQVEYNNDVRGDPAAEGQYYGPVCLLSVRKKGFPKRTSITVSFNEQNALTPEKPLQNVWIPNETSMAVPQYMTPQEQIPFGTPIPSLPESALQITTEPQPKFGLEKPSSEIISEASFLPAPPAPNMPFYGAQPPLNEYGTPSQSIVSNEEQNIENRYPPAQLGDQRPPVVYPQQPPIDNSAGQVTSPPFAEPSPNSYPPQLPVFLPQNQGEATFGGNPQVGALVNPQNMPLPRPSLPFNAPTPNPEFPVNYPPPSAQSPQLNGSPELPPPGFNNNPSEVQFPGTPVGEQVSDIRPLDNNFVPDQQQTSPTITKSNIPPNQPMAFNQLPPTPSQEPPMNSMEVPPPDSFSSKGPLYPDSLANSKEGVSDSYNLPVANPFQPPVPPTSQPYVTPDLTAAQGRPFDRQPLIPPSQYQQNAIPEFQPALGYNTQNDQEGGRTSDNPAIASFPNEPVPNTFVQPGSGPAGNVPPSLNFPEQIRNNFDSPQQAFGVMPVEIPPPQSIPTPEPQPSSVSEGQQFANNGMFGPAPDNFQKIGPGYIVPPVPVSAVAPESDITKQTGTEGSQLNFPPPISNPSTSGFAPNNIGNQLSELTTYNKPVINPNDFQPETDSYFTEPSDRNLDYTTQTPFYDSIPAAYKREPESQPDLISSAQNLSGERPASDQAFSPPGFERFPITPLRSELPPLTPNATVTESDFGSFPINPNFANRNGYQMVPPGPIPQSAPQTFTDGGYTPSLDQPNPVPGIPNQFVPNQPPLNNNPFMPVPPFDPNQNVGLQQPPPEIASQNSVQTQQVENQPDAAVFPQTPRQFPGPVNQIQPDSNPPNALPYPENREPNGEFYPVAPQYQPPAILPYQPAGPQFPSPQSQFVNSEVISPQSGPNTIDAMRNGYQPGIVPAAPGTPAGEFPTAVEQSNKDGYDNSQIPSANYPNPGFPNGQVGISTPPTPLPQNFPPQSDPSLNYGRFQQNTGLPQPGNEQFSSQITPNSPPSEFPLQSAPLNSQNSLNPNEFQASGPPESLQPVGPYPLVPLQNIPQNSQANNFPLDLPLRSTIPPAPESLTKEMDNLTLNPDQPAGVSQPEPQNLNTYNQFPPTVPPQFTSQSSDESVPVNTDYPKPYQPQPSGDYYGEVPRVQTTNQMVASTEEYQGPAAKTGGPLNYSQGMTFGPGVPGETLPPPTIQSDQILTSATQAGFVQENPQMYSPNVPFGPQPQPSLDNLTEIPGDKTANGVTPAIPQTSLVSDIKPETFGSQPPSQTAFTETTAQDIMSTETPDAQPKPGNLNYLGPQPLQNFNGPVPAANSPPYFPQTPDSVTGNRFDDPTYQRPNVPFTPYQAITPPGINPSEMVGSSDGTSSLSRDMPFGEPSQVQPNQETAPLIAPQPQSETRVTYNDEITEQYQSSPAFNPQPQAALKFADQLPRDNVGEELPQAITSQPTQVQQEMGQYQPQLLPLPVPNGGEVVNGPIPNAPPQFDQSMQRPQAQLPPFSRQSGEEVLNDSFGRPAPGFGQQVPQPQPEIPPFSTSNGGESPENSAAQVGQQMEQFQPQLRPLYGPNNGEVVPNNYATLPPQFDQQRGQWQTQLQPLSGPNNGEVINDSFAGRPPQFGQQMEQPQTALQPLPGPNMGQTLTESYSSSTSQVDPQRQYQPQLPPFSPPNEGQIVPDSLVTPAPVFDQQTEQPEPRIIPFSGQNSQEGVNVPLQSGPPQFDQQMGQDQARLPPFYGPNRAEPISEPIASTSAQFEKQIQQPQPLVPLGPQFQQQIQQPQPMAPQFGQQIQQPQLPGPQFQQQIQQPQPLGPPLSGPNGEVVNESFGSQPPQFGQQMEQPQTQLQPFSRPRTAELGGSPPQSDQQLEQPQPQIPPFSGPNRAEGIPESSIIPVPQFNQQMVQNGLQGPFFYGSSEREDDSYASRPQQLDQQMRQLPPQVPPFSGPLNSQPQPGQPQTQVQLLPGPNVEAAVTESFPRPPNQFGQQQVPPFFTQNRGQIEADSFVTPAPQFEQPTGQPQTQLQPFYGPNAGEPVTDSSINSVTQIEQSMGQPQPQNLPFLGTNMAEGRTDSFPSRPPQIDQQAGPQYQPQLPPFYGPNGPAQDLTETTATPAPQFDQQMGQYQPQVLPFPVPNRGENVNDPVVSGPPQLDQRMGQDQAQLPPFYGPNRAGPISEPSASSTAQFEQQIQQPQPMGPPSFGSNGEEVVNDTFGSRPPQFGQQPQAPLQPLPGPNMGEPLTEPYGSSTQIDPQRQYQPQLPPLSPPSEGQIVPDGLVTPAPAFNQPMEQSETQLQPFTTPITPVTMPAPFASSPQFEPPMGAPQPQLSPFPAPNREGAPAPEFGQPIGQPQTQLQPFSGPNREEIMRKSYAPPNWNTFPTNAGNWNSEQNFLNSQSSQTDAGVNMARDVNMSAPRPDSLVPVSDPTDPSNGPDRTRTGTFDYMPAPLRKPSYPDRMGPVSRLENF